MRDESAAAVSARPTADPHTSREGSRTVTGGRPIESYPPRYETSRHGRRDAYAALDLGTNNCRLLIAEPTPNGFRVIDAFSRIVRLGEGLGNSNRLTEAAIERTVEALRICRGKMKSRAVARSKVIATEACREGPIPLRETAPGRLSRCLRAEDMAARTLARVSA